MPELLQEMYYGPNVQNLIESDDCKVIHHITAYTCLC